MDAEVSTSLVSAVASTVITWAMLADRAYRNRGSARWWIVPAAIATVALAILATLLTSLAMVLPFDTRPLSLAVAGVVVASAVAYFAAPVRERAAMGGPADPDPRARSERATRMQGRGRDTLSEPPLSVQVETRTPESPTGAEVIATLIDVVLKPPSGRSDGVAADAPETLLTLVDEVIDVELLEGAQR